MSALFLMIIASICFAAVFLIAFIWSVHSNQYEDMKGASMRFLQEESSSNTNQQQSKNSL